MDRFLNGEAIRARPIRAYERMMKWAKRRPAIAAMTVGIILVAILGFAGITWQWRAAVEAREQARTERDKALLAEARATKERDAAEDARSRETAARRQATAARRKAELSRERSQDALCRSLYEQARALRLLGQSGRRWRVLDLIKQAEALRARKRGVPAEPGGGAELLTQHELRGEALAALLLRDGRVVEQSAGLTHGVSPHGRFALAVWIDPGRQTGGVRLVDLVANKELMNLEGEKRVKAIGAPIAMALGPDGKRLASVTMDFCGVVIAELPSGKRLRELKLPAALAQSTPKSIFRKAFEAGKRAYERGKKHSPRESAALKAPPAVEARAGKPVPPSAKTAPGQTPRSLTQVGKEPGPAPKLSSKSETIKLTQGPVTVESNAPRSRLRYIAFGPNGRYLVGALFPPNIVIWNLESKDPEGRLLPGKNFPLASFSPDGRLLAYAGDDNKVILWNLAANRIEKEIQTDWRPGGPVAFFPNNKHLAIYCIKDDSQTGPTWEGAIIRWDIEAGRAVDRIETRTGVSTSPLAVSADGRRIALADANGMVHVLLLTASREPQWLALQHGAMVQQLVWQPNGRLVSSGLGSLKIWEFAQEPPMRTLPLSPQAAGRKGRFALSPDGRWVAMEKAGGRDVWLFDRETGALLQTIHHAARGPFLAYQLGFSPDARVLVRLGYGGMIAWDVPGGQQHARLATDLRKGESAWSVGFAADSKFLVGGILGRQPAVRDAETKDTLWKGGNAPGHVAILSRDGRLFAVYPSFFMGKKATISVRELPGGKERFHVEHPRRFGLQMLARFSPRSHWLARFELLGIGPAGPSNMPSGAMAMVPLDMRGKNEWTATIWDVATGDKHLELRGPSSVEEFEFSADDRYLALALRDGTVQLWDVEGKRHLFDWQAWPNEAGTGAPQQGRRYLAFTPDSSSLAVLDPKGNRLRFLDLKRLRQQLDPIGLAW